MLSKEEIEKMKNTFEYRDIERLKKLCVNKSVQRFEFNDLIALDNLIKDYEILETDKQKLIQKLEKDTENITKTMQDGKHWDDYSRCRLKAYRTKTKEILKELQGEK